LPPTCGVRHFKKGIADFSQVTGTEHKHIARILLASLTGKVDQRGIIACKALLNFIHLAQYPSHDEDTLGYMDLELNVWHKNKAYFVKQQTTKDQINIPKFHSLLHYVNSIKWLGTTDNYNTEAFERFHIDMAKEAWDATDKRNHFPQMTQWLSRQEKILSFDFYRNWINSTSTNQGAQKNDITLKLDTNIRIAKHPHETKKSLNAIANSHNAPGFILALKLYINSLLPKEGQVTKAEALSIGCLPFTLLDVWHHFKFTPVNLFDDAGCRVARLRVIFRLPNVVKRLGQRSEEDAPPNWPKAETPLAYVTWFSQFKSVLDSKNGMYRVQPSVSASNGTPQGEIIPLSDIRQSCMLVPSSSDWEGNGWTSDNILDKCPAFFVNNFQSKYTYQMIY
ncbi:hypothetical protein BDP27DRAFT_1240267, partial [Rhodocollybia butyracea]